MRMIFVAEILLFTDWVSQHKNEEIAYLVDLRAGYHKNIPHIVPTFLQRDLLNSVDIF
jgi:hypothetical protein